ncbi:hypothetical protein BDAP_001584 [Binucleata daphniae]
MNLLNSILYNKSFDPTIASAAISPFSYHGHSNEDISLFLIEINHYIVVHKLNEEQALYILKLSLQGEANVWVRGIPDDMKYNTSIQNLMTRFQTRNTQLFYIKRLLNACQNRSDRTLLSLLDEHRLSAKKGNITDDVTVTMALISLSDDYEGPIYAAQIPGNRLDWNELYGIANIYKN